MRTHHKIMFAMLAGWSVVVGGANVSAYAMDAWRTVQGPAVVEINSAGTMPPCPTEDSASCYWDADDHGASFYTDAAGTPTYLP